MLQNRTQWMARGMIYFLSHCSKDKLASIKNRQGSVTPQSDMLGGTYSKKDRWSLIADLHCRSLITEISSKVIDSACSGRQHVISSNFLSKCEGLNSTDSFTYFPYSYGNRVMRKLEEWNILSARKREHELWGLILPPPLCWRKQKDYFHSHCFPLQNCLCRNGIILLGRACFLSSWTSSHFTA